MYILFAFFAHIVWKFKVCVSYSLSFFSKYMLQLLTKQTAHGDVLMRGRSALINTEQAEVMSPFHTQASGTIWDPVLQLFRLWFWR